MNSLTSTARAARLSVVDQTAVKECSPAIDVSPSDLTSKCRYPLDSVWLAKRTTPMPAQHPIMHSLVNAGRKGSHARPFSARKLTFALVASGLCALAPLRGGLIKPSRPRTFAITRIALISPILFAEPNSQPLTTTAYARNRAALLSRFTPDRI